MKMKYEYLETPGGVKFLKWGDLSFLWNACSKICNSVFEQNKNSEDFFEYTGNTFLFLNHHKYFNSYMNRDNPNRNQFK